MEITEDILSTEQHLQFRILKAVSEFAQSVPGIFLQETKGSIEGSAAPALYCMVTNFIHLLNDWKHFFRRHSRCNQ